MASGPLRLAGAEVPTGRDALCPQDGLVHSLRRPDDEGLPGVKLPNMWLRGVWSGGKYPARWSQSCKHQLGVAPKGFTQVSDFFGHLNSP